MPSVSAGSQTRRQTSPRRWHGTTRCIFLPGEREETLRLTGSGTTTAGRRGEENIVRYCSDMSRGMIDRFAEFDTPSFDLLHFHDWHVVDVLRRLQERETIFTYHSTEFGRNGNRFSGGWPFSEISAIERYGASIAKHITAVSSTLRREAMNLYDIPDWKIDVVHNGIVPGHYPGRRRSWGG